MWHEADHISAGVTYPSYIRNRTVRVFCVCENNLFFFLKLDEGFFSASKISLEVIDRNSEDLAFMGHICEHGVCVFYA